MPKKEEPLEDRLKNAEKIASQITDKKLKKQVMKEIGDIRKGIKDFDSLNKKLESAENYGRHMKAELKSAKEQLHKPPHYPGLLARVLWGIGGAAVLTAALYIGGYIKNPLAQPKERPAAVETIQQKTTAQKLDGAYKNFCENEPWSRDDKFFYATSLVSDMSYSANDIKEFISKTRLKPSAGYFLSALMNRISDKTSTFDLEFKEGAEHLDGIGAFIRWGIDLNITGDVGDYLGYNMSGGSITVDGEAGDYVGCYAKGGDIYISTVAGEEVGYDADEDADIRIRTACRSVSYSNEGRVVCAGDDISYDRGDEFWFAITWSLIAAGAAFGASAAIKRYTKGSNMDEDDWEGAGGLAFLAGLGSFLFTSFYYCW